MMTAHSEDADVLSRIADEIVRIATTEAFVYFEADGSIADEAVPSDFLPQFAAECRLRASLERGLEQSSAGDVHDLGSFAEFGETS